MILPIYSVLAKLERSMIEAAQDLGAGRFQVLTKIILPHSMPGIASGLTMVFVPSVVDFLYQPKSSAAERFDLIGDTIERQFQTSYNYHLGAAISFVLMILILVCISVLNKFTVDDEGGPADMKTHNTHLHRAGFYIPLPSYRRHGALLV